MPAFSMALARRPEASGSRSGPSPDGNVPPHLVQAAAMHGAAADRSSRTGARHDASIALHWDCDERYETDPIRVDSADGWAWLDGRVSQSDVEVEQVLTQVVSGDIDACARLRGTYSVWSWNSRTRTFRAVVDPFARRPVYWSLVRGALAAATELRQVLAHPDMDVGLDESVLVAMLAQLDLSASTTAYVGVAFVPPGHVLEATVGHDPTVRPWMAWPDDVDLGHTQQEWAEQLSELTLQALRRGLPEGNAGITLSGGLDSSMLTGMAVSLVGGSRLTALTMRFPGLPNDETRYQDMMLTATGIEEISVGVQNGFDYWEAICTLVERRRWPVRWLQPEIEALIAAAAAAGLRSVVRGVGGDELFSPGSATVVDALVSRQFGHAGQFLGGPPLHAQLRWGMRGVRGAMGQVLPDAVRSRSVPRHLPAWLTPSDRIRGSLGDLTTAPPRGLGLSAAMHRDRWRRFGTDGAQEQTNWTDASETGGGVAMIDPLLDVDLVRAAMRVPESLRWAPGDPRRLQRGVAHRYLPAAVMRRPDKAYMGSVTFTHLRQPAVVSVLEDLELARRGVVDATKLRELHRATLAAHDRGDRHLPGGPIDLAMVLSVEAALRAVK